MRPLQYFTVKYEEEKSENSFAYYMYISYDLQNQVFNIREFLNRNIEFWSLKLP